MNNLIIFLSIALPSAVALATILMWRLIFLRDKRRSPVNFKVINLPGEQLRRRIAKDDDAISEAWAMIVLSGPCVLSVWLINQVSRIPGGWSQVKLGPSELVLAVFLVLWLGLSIRKFTRRLNSRQRYREGLRAELATAQNLQGLLASGCTIFHDFPADKFNIDHVVVASHAVFSIETKSRKKPERGGRDSARVTYDGKFLKFPGWIESKPVEQSLRQAEWLRNHLLKKTGSRVKVVPVLSLPGWFVEQAPIRRPEVLVSNCKNPGFALSPKFGPPMEQALRLRIENVLMEQYPELE